jgi:threonine dehydrogenase-like Zn-dependent dehydrogenase
MRALTYHGVHNVFDEIDDPAELIVEQTKFRGVDAAIDAVGFEAKGSTVETVLANLKLEGGSGKALRQCMAAVRRGGKPDIIITHRMKLAEAAEGYRIFNKKEEDCRKVVLTP